MHKILYTDLYRDLIHCTCTYRIIAKHVVQLNNLIKITKLQLITNQLHAKVLIGLDLYVQTNKCNKDEKIGCTYMCSHVLHVYVHV